jgi:hypothetical protein
MSGPALTLLRHLPALQIFFRCEPAQIAGRLYNISPLKFHASRNKGI